MVSAQSEPEHRAPGEWNAIAAMARNRVIGRDGMIPWHVPDDFKWVKRKTKGHVIVMGRRTFESLGGPLPRRTNVVLSHTMPQSNGITVLPDLLSLKSWAATAPGQIWIFGGATIYRQTLSLCSDLYLSIINSEPDGDTFFPEFEDAFQLNEIVAEFPEFTIHHYKRFRHPADPVRH